MNDRFLVHNKAAEEKNMDEPASDNITQENNSSYNKSLQPTAQEKILEKQDFPAVQQTPSLIKAQSAAQKTNGDGHQPWFSDDEVESLQSRWMDIQTKFVDTPDQALSQGDELVSETVERVREMVSSHYESLCDKWSNHNDLSTEDMRIVMQDYRSLLFRLLD